MNRKSVFCVLTALTLCLSLTACGGGKAAQTPAPVPSAPAAQSNPPAESQAPNLPEAYPDTYFFLVGDFAVTIDQDMAEVLAALGEPQSYFEAASCAFEGLDKIYTYSGFQITTRPEGDKDYVNSILLTDDSVTTPEGAYIGALKEDAYAAYGQRSEGPSGSLSLTLDNVTLSLICENDKVISIEYLPA